MNHASPGDVPRADYWLSTGLARLDLESEERSVPPELAAWHVQWNESHLLGILKQRTHLKFRDLASHRREPQAGHVRGLFEAMSAAGALGRLPALANRLGQAAAVTGELALAAECFRDAAAGLADGPARAVLLQNLFLLQVDRREYPSAVATLADLARFAPRELPLPLDRYEVEQPLGLGPFGLVLLCRDRLDERRVVVKSPAETPPGGRGPLVEAEILSSLDHPGIPQCYAQGYVDPPARRPYYVVEWFDGLCLHDYVARFGSLSWGNFRPILALLVETLRALHERGIIHCDLKPGNVLVRCDHTGWHVKLIDFGIAVREDDDSAALVPEQPRPFTMGFGAPEQRGPSAQARLTTAVDLYGLGRTILFCLCGQPDPQPELRDLLPAGLGSLVASCLSADPALRPSADELLGQLAALPVPEGPPRFPSTHLTAGTSTPRGDSGTRDSSDASGKSDTDIPKQPGTGV
jgi:hypothetical protein